MALVGVLGLSLVGCGRGQFMRVARDTQVTDGGTKQSVSVVIDHGYQPSIINAVPDVPLELSFYNSEQEPSCADEVTVPLVNFIAKVRTGNTAEVTIPPQPEGTVIPFHCTMEMMEDPAMHGEIRFGTPSSETATSSEP